MFACERARIVCAAGGIDIVVEHIGSTSVAGLLAKPIIDIAILLRCESHRDALNAALCSIDYIDCGDKGAGSGHLFVRDCQPNVRTHHTHVVGHDDPAWSRWLAFRDALREDARIRAEFSCLKRALAQLLGNDRPAYTEAKSAFVAGVVEARALR